MKNKEEQKRIIKLSELKPTTDPIACLPGNLILLNPTQTELEIIKIYSQFIPVQLIGVCQEQK
jgi:hypothetical protein